MSEPQARFRVHTVIDTPTQLEASKGVKTRLASMLQLTLYVLFVVMAGVQLWAYVQNGKTRDLVLCCVLLLVLGWMVYNGLTMQKRGLRRWEQNVEKTYGTKALHLTTEFYDHVLIQTLEENGETVERGYSSLGELRQTEHLILLRSGKQQWFFLARDGIEGGTEAEFLAFLRQVLPAE